MSKRVEREATLLKALSAIGFEGYDESIADDASVFAKLIIAIAEAVKPGSNGRFDGTKIMFEPTVQERATTHPYFTPERLFSMFTSDRMANIDHLIDHVIPTVVSTLNGALGIDIVEKDGRLDVALPSTSTIVPLLKPRATIDATNAHQRKTMVELGAPADQVFPLVEWHFLDRVYVIPTFDSPDGFMFIDEGMLPHLSKTVPEITEIALENLRRISKKIKVRTDYTKQPVVAIDRINGMASSLLLLSDFWEKEALKAKDELVIHVTETDELLVVRRSDKRGLTLLISGIMSGRIKTMFTPPLLFVYGVNGMRILKPQDLPGVQ
jgi:hypothetical protein